MSDDQGIVGAAGHRRRALLAGVGALGASVVLAGCGSDESAGATGAIAGDNDSGATRAPSTTGTTGSTGGTDADTATRFARTTDVPVGGGKVYPEQGVVVTQPVAGEFKGFSAICTHQGCPVATVAGGTINCTCHGSRFSIEDGSVRNGPATKPLSARQIKIDGENIALG